MHTTSPFTGNEPRRTGRPQPAFPALASRPVIPLRAGYTELGAAQEIAPALRALGVEPASVFEEAGLDLRLFDNAANVIPHATLGRLLTLCVARTRCEHFGLLVGRRATILALGLVGRLMKHSETLGDALNALVSNFSTQNRGSVPSLAISDDVALFGFSVYQSNVESAEQIADAALAVTVNAIRVLCGSDWQPAEVLLPRAAPANSEPFRRHYRTAVRFNQEVATLVVPVRNLALRIPGADPLLRGMIEERIRRQKGDPRSEFSDDIRRLLRTRLAGDRCSAHDIGSLLDMHRRTLSRRLKSTGSGYRTLTNEIRFEIARQLLEDTEVSLGQVAAALGYSEASAFTRAFRRWSGQTPTTWRSHSDTDDEL